MNILVINLVDRLIDFKDMSTYLGLIYTKSSGNSIHYTFISFAYGPIERE